MAVATGGSELRQLSSSTRSPFLTLNTPSLVLLPSTTQAGRPFGSPSPALCQCSGPAQCAAVPPWTSKQSTASN